MVSINWIDDNLIPKDIELCKRGVKTKKIFLKKDDLTGDYSSTEEVFAKNENESFNFQSSFHGAIGTMHIVYKKDDKLEDSQMVVQYISGKPFASHSFLIELDNPVEIMYDIPKYIYCIEDKAPEIITTEKITEDISINSINNYINKTTDSIKSCKSYISYIINSKNGNASDTETLESLIDKLKYIKF